MSDVLQVAVSILVNPDGQVFLLRRCAKRDIGCWEFPVGKVDPGELILDAASRELKEEAGVTVVFTAGDVYRTEKTVGRDGQPLQVFTFIKHMDKSWESAKHKERDKFDGSGWFMPEKALDMTLTDPVRQMVAQF